MHTDCSLNSAGNSRSQWLGMLSGKSGLLLLAGIIAIIGAWRSDLIWHHKPPSAKQNPTRAPSIAIPQAVTPPAPKGNDTSISKVPQPLLLTGTMPGRNAREGQAFIGVDASSPQTYQAGALLVNGVRLAEIYTDHVVLEKDTQRVNLYLQGSGHPIPDTLKKLVMVGGEPPPPPIKATSHEVITDYLRPSPVYDNNQLKGYQVYPGQQADIFTQLGLQPGDILLTLNGVPLNEPHTVVSLLQQLALGSAMTASVERQGKTESLSLDGALITNHQQQGQNPISTTVMSMP